MNSALRKLAAGSLVALTLAGTAIVSAAPASAQCYGRGCGWHGGHHYGRGWGGPLAAGIIGGLALGAIAGAATAPGPYYDAPPVYGPPGGCYYVRRPVYDQWGNYLGSRPTQVCE